MNWKRIFVTVLRVGIGWHFLYEGITKLYTPEWSAYNYLINSTGFMSGFYEGLASSPALMKAVDILNIYGLIFIGLALFLGILIRYAAIAGTLLLTLYYFAYPPFGYSIFSGTEGNLYIVNRIFIEALALMVLIFIKEKGYGLYAISFSIFKKQPSGGGDADAGDMPNSSAEAVVDPGDMPNSRREMLKNMATVPALGLVGWGAFRESQKYGPDALSGATIQVGAMDLSELQGELPKGKIGDHEISKLVLGGNLLGGWAHSRDLLYVPSLFRAYNTEKKIFETLMLAEQAGVNTINIGFVTNPVIEKYKKVTGGKIKVISQVHPDMENDDYYVNIDKAIDHGCEIIQVQGNWCDWLVRDGRIDVVEKMLDHIRKQGCVAGLASHTVDALIACEEEGIIPDYYMKTMHHDQYWSAHPIEKRVPFEVDGKKHVDHNRFHDNIFCLFPDRTVEFVNRAKVPVMGFKILAAGAIPPEDGFRWAFQNGADFICVGMFDFQIVKDVNITIDVLNDMSLRPREWYG